MALHYPIHIAISWLQAFIQSTSRERSMEVQGATGIYILIGILIVIGVILYWVAKKVD